MQLLLLKYISVFFRGGRQTNPYNSEPSVFLQLSDKYTCITLLSYDKLSAQHPCSHSESQGPPAALTTQLAAAYKQLRKEAE